ncbi:hypothetical protein [Streptomyces cinerochromogenes]|uniref:hypothetical protein n=1 Tax=Streptomyces cinerochromogenes TaxID=66422 RepID=UPI0033B9A07E
MNRPGRTTGRRPRARGARSRFPGLYGDDFAALTRCTANPREHTFPLTRTEQPSDRTPGTTATAR